MSIADEIFRVEGLQVNDGQAAHFGKTATESLQDAERRFLLAAIVAVGFDGTIEDLWHQYNVEQAFTTSNDIGEIRLAYWTSK